MIYAMILSMLLNAALGFSYLNQRDDLAKLAEDYKTAQGNVDICNKATERLEGLATDRLVEAEGVRLAARAAAQTRNQRADKILSTPASVVGDDCRSASDRANAWLAGRGQL